MAESHRLVTSPFSAVAPLELLPDRTYQRGVVTVSVRSMRRRWSIARAERPALTSQLTQQLVGREAFLGLFAADGEEQLNMHVSLTARYPMLSGTGE